MRCRTGPDAFRSTAEQWYAERGRASDESETKSRPLVWSFAAKVDCATRGRIVPTPGAAKTKQTYRSSRLPVVAEPLIGVGFV